MRFFIKGAPAFKVNKTLRELKKESTGAKLSKLLNICDTKLAEKSPMPFSAKFVNEEGLIAVMLAKRFVDDKVSNSLHFSSIFIYSLVDGLEQREAFASVSLV